MKALPLSRVCMRLVPLSSGEAGRWGDCTLTGFVSVRYVSPASPQRLERSGEPELVEFLQDLGAYGVNPMAHAVEAPFDVLSLGLVEQQSPGFEGFQHYEVV